MFDELPTTVGAYVAWVVEVAWSLVVFVVVMAVMAIVLKEVGFFEFLRDNVLVYLFR